MAEPSGDMTRRTLFRRGGTAALGAAVVWSAPSIRTIALRADAAGTPPPRPGTHQVDPPDDPTQNAPGDPVSGEQTTGGAPTDPAAVAPASEGGSLPFTGSDPRPLLIKGGTAIAAGSAIIGIVHGTEPGRGEN